MKNLNIYVLFDITLNSNMLILFKFQLRSGAYMSGHFVIYKGRSKNDKD